MLEVLFTATLKILLYLFIFLAGLWCWFQWTYRDMIRAASKVPVTLKTLPVLGHAHYTVFGMDRVTRYALDMITVAVAQGIHTVCFWCGPLPIIMLNGVEDIQKVLNSSVTLEKGDEMNFMKFAMGNSILTAPGNIWRVKRRYMNYLFHPRNLEQMGPLFNKCSRDYVSLLSEHVGRGPVDVMDYSMDVALKAICHLCFGYDININMKSTSFRDVKIAIERLLDYSARRIVRVWLRSDTIFNFLYRKELKEINDSWKIFTEETLKDGNAKNQSERQKSSSQVENAINGSIDSLADGPIDLQDVYSVLLKSYPLFTEKDMWHEMMTMYVAGTDTAAASTSSSLLALAQHQDIQERLYKEIMSVVGPDDDVTQEDLNRMPYLEQVFKESLRWFSIVPFIVRKPKEDLELSACTVPKGNTVILALFGIHMDPQFYPDPKKFDPDRFSSTNINENKKYSFLPFSGGPRNCIGKTYSHLLVKTILVHVLRRFKVTTTMDINSLKRKLAITLISSEGYHISLEERS